MINLMMKATFDDESYYYDDFGTDLHILMMKATTFDDESATSFYDNNNFDRHLYNISDLIYSLLYYKISFIIACFRLRLAMNINKT